MAVGVGDLVTADLLNSLCPEPTSSDIQVTSSGSIGTSTAPETTLNTIASATYLANTAYEVLMQGGFTHSTTTVNVFVKVRKGTATGTVVVDFTRTPEQNSTNSHGVFGKRIFTVGASDVTTALVATGFTNSGTSTHVGNAQAPRGFYIIPCGSASAYPSEPVLS